MKLAPLPPAGSRIGVAVSGGADSTALLVWLRELGAFELSAVHVNHGWRGADSDADAEFCRALAAGLGIPFHLRTASSPAATGNLEEQARNLRLQFFDELIETKQVDFVLTAHTADDQAETVLFRLLRGASLQGLAGIHPQRGGILRPMLRVRRSEVIAYLNERRQSWREDASNADTAFRRNRIRHELLPQLERDWNPEIVRALSQTAQLAWDEQQYWEESVARTAAGVFRFQGNTATVDASKLMSHPVAVARRLIRWVLLRIKGDIRSIEHAHIEAVLELARSEQPLHGHGRVILPGVDIMRSFEWLRFAPYAPGSRDRVAERISEVQLSIPALGEMIEAIAADGSVIRLEMVASRKEPSTWNENDTLESSEIGCGAVVHSQCVTLRNWRPGDRYRPKGRMSEEKLKVMFQESRVPLWDRGTWPIISVDDQIIWAHRFGPAAASSSDNGEVDERVLRISRVAPECGNFVKFESPDRDE
jgi:tRNA(Ile)-lysidine synthase